MDLRFWLPPACRKYGVLVTSVSTIFFKSLDHGLKGCTPPEVISRKGSDYIWKWRNMVVSWIHALLIGSWDLLCFYYYPSLMDDPVDHVVPFTYYMVCISTGYFLFDFWDMFVHRKVFKLWELSLHHVAVLSAFVYNVVSVKYIAYTAIALLAEVNSIFLHTRKLMQMHKVPFTSSIYRLNAFVNLVTFACCRGYCLFRITYGMYLEPHRVSLFYMTLLCTSMFIMNLLNPVLFWILFRNDFLRVSPPSRKLSKIEFHPMFNGTGMMGEATRFSDSITLAPLHSSRNGNDLILTELDLT